MPGLYCRTRSSTVISCTLCTRAVLNRTTTTDSAEATVLFHRALLLKQDRVVPVPRFPTVHLHGSTEDDPVSQWLYSRAVSEADVVGIRFWPSGR